MTYAEQLDAWFKKEQETKGLLDIKFFIKPGSTASVEELCKEILAVIAAPTIPLPDDSKL
jgi:hypothetical protein